MKGVNTEIYPENSNGGLMICGVNPGYSVKDKKQERNPQVGKIKKSFFSDRTVHDNNFRNRIVKWFELWGYKLARDSGKEGPLERSIIQTNWLVGRSENMKGKSTIGYCVHFNQEFLIKLNRFKPSAIIFLSQDLMESLHILSMDTEFSNILGMPSGNPTYHKKTLNLNGKPCRRFRVGFHDYEKARILSLPHPTGSIGLHDQYIHEFQDEISKFLSLWWSAHSKEINSPHSLPARLTPGS